MIKNKFVSKKYLKYYISLTLIVSSIAFYKLVYNPNIYLKCYEDQSSPIFIYQFNRSEFKWLFDRAKTSFKYTKKVKHFSDTKAEYVGQYNNPDIAGNQQDVSIDRMNGKITWYWKNLAGEPKSQSYYCFKLTTLPKPIKPEF